MIIHNKVKLDYLNNVRKIPNSTSLQDIHITENTNINSVQDGPGVVIRCRNLIIDAGVTWSISNRCAGWTIVANGDITINGTISIDAKGIEINETTYKIEGCYGASNRKITPYGNNNYFGTLKSFTIAAGEQTGNGGILNIYSSGNITIGATGVISSNGATGKNGGKVRVYYTKSMVNNGSITANGGTGGTVGTITVEDLTYYITEYQKILSGGEYIYTICDLGKGKALIGTRATGKIFYTSDWGVNWTNQGVIASSNTVRDFCDLGNGHILAAIGAKTASGAKIYETTNWGTNWTLKATLGTEERVCCFCNLGSGVILAGTRAGAKVYKSTDSGATWTSKGSLGASSGNNCRSMIYLGNDIVLAGTKKGAIYKSTDAGETWTLKQTLTTDKKVRYFANLGNGIVLAGDQAGKVWKSSDYGNTWTLKKTFYTKQEIQEFKSIVGNKILVSMSPTKVASTDTQKHVAVSEDAGNNWRIIDTLSSSQTNSYAINRQNILFENILPCWINIPINHFGAT